MSMRLYVGNLAYTVTSDELKDAFAQFGEIANATVLSDKFTGRSKGFGFVEFVNDADGQEAIKKMDGADLGGRPLRVNEARPREENSGGGSRGGNGGGGRGGFGGGRGGYSPRH